MKILRVELLCIAILLFAGCSPPPGAGGPPPGFAVPVIVEEVRPQAFTQNIEVVGTLLAAQEVEVAARVEGFVKQIHFQDGQRVERGDVLFELDSERYQAALDQALARERLAQEEFDRADALRRNRTISAQEFDRVVSTLDEARAAVRLARENLSDTKIRAPFAGAMTERRVDVGQFVNRGQVLSSIVDNSSLRVEFRVPERFIGSLQTGSQVEFRTSAFPGEKFFGTVFFLSPRVDESSRTLLMRAQAENPELRLKPGMFVNVLVTTDSNPEAKLIAETALMFRGNSVSVFTVNGENLVEMRRVAIRSRVAGRVEIVEGLEFGEKVITEGIQKVGPGSLVQPMDVMEKAASSGENAEAGV